MSPRDFWDLTPDQFWLLMDANKPVKMYGKMTEYEVKSIYEETYGVIEDD